jgi:hypothetical protein
MEFDKNLEGFLVAERLRGRKIDKDEDYRYCLLMQPNVFLADEVQIYDNAIRFCVSKFKRSGIRLVEFLSIRYQKYVYVKSKELHNHSFVILIHTKPEIIIHILKNVDSYIEVIKKHNDDSWSELKRNGGIKVYEMV